jgi:hypothetical protein
MSLKDINGKEISRRYLDRPLVVIYCHPDKAKGFLMPLDHWDRPLIDKLIKHKFGANQVSVYTLDPFVGEKRKSADIVMNGFSNEFIYSHQAAFDMLILPDCGGVWATMSDAGDINGLVEIIKNLMFTIKPNGSLCVSKFINVNIKDVADAFIASGYRVETMGDTAHSYLIITNPPYLGGRRRKTRRVRRRNQTKKNKN